MTQFMEWNLSILTYLAEHRNGFLTTVMAALTYLGSEYLMIALIALIYLCFDKKLAYKIGFSVFISGAAVQIAKLTCRIERPWTLISTKYRQFEGRYSVADKLGSKKGASGYSFPSGHSQTSAAFYGTAAVSGKKKIWTRILLWAIVALVMFTRLYLGVHTPLDVVVGFLIGLLIVLAVHAVFDKIYADTKYDLAVSLVLIAVSAAAIVVTLILKKMHPEIEDKMVTDCIKMSASGAGFAIGYFVERRFIRFDPKCGSVGDKIVRLIAGIGGIFAIKEGVKYLGRAIFKHDTYGMDIARYLLMFLFAMCLLPYLVTKLHKKKDKTASGKKNVRKSRGRMQKKSKKANYKK